MAKAPTHPDQVLLRYLELSQRLRSPASQDPVIEEGFRYADRCAGCGWNRFREQKSKDRTAVVCERCSKPWGLIPGVLLKGDFSSQVRVSGNNINAVRRARNPHGVEAIHAEAATYGVALSKLDFWARRLYLILYCFENTGSYVDVAAEAARRWPRSSRTWSEWKVRQVVNESRNLIWISLHGRPWTGGRERWPRKPEAHRSSAR